MKYKFSHKTLILFIVMVVISLLPDVLIHEKLSDDANLAFKMVILMIFLWFTELIPISVTALIPIVFSPFFHDTKINEIIGHYASPVVFLLLGGFIIAQGFEKSGLHKRIALKALVVLGDTRERILICIIFSTAFFSMWLSNTATCLLMLPIVQNIIEHNFSEKKDKYFTKILLLSIAYASSIGGMATPIGTIPNAILIGFMKETHNIDIDFIDWFMFSSPLVVCLLLFLFLFMRYKIKENKAKLEKSFISSNYNRLGKLTYEEKITSLILVLTIGLWLFKSYLNDFYQIRLTDSVIAIFGSILFFVIPCKKNKFILSFDWYKNVPWNVLLLFGGGLAMASLIISTGLANEFSKTMDIIGSLHFIFIILLITFITSLLTEFTSNTATTFLLLPLLSLFAINNDMNILQITIPFVLAASCAFMMPIATPPNAIVYSSNKFDIPFMMKNGIYINLVSVLSISFYVYLSGSL